MGCPNCRSHNVTCPSSLPVTRKRPSSETARSRIGESCGCSIAGLGIDSLSSPAIGPGGTLIGLVSVCCAVVSSARIVTTALPSLVNVKSLPSIATPLPVPATFNPYVPPGSHMSCEPRVMSRMSTCSPSRRTASFTPGTCDSMTTRPRLVAMNRTVIRAARPIATIPMRKRVRFDGMSADCIAIGAACKLVAD